MGIINRGFKNAFRNSIRTISIVFILAVSISMALVMLMSLKTVQAKIDAVKSTIGNNISISPAGIHGFEGGGTLLTDANITTISQLPNVTKVVKTLSDRLTNGTDTNLQSAIDAGSFGNRQNSRQQTGTTSNNPNTPQRTFTPPIQAIATSDLTATASFNATSFNVTAGNQFDVGSTDLVAMLGQDLAIKNNLTVGSTFTAYNQTIKVVGLYDAGNTFANATLLMPISTLQTLSSQTGQISSAIVQASSIDTVSSVTDSIKTALGSAADVTSQQDASNQAIAPLQNIKTISLYSLIGALVAGAIIIFLTMVMIVRERRREIGVLKAIGASNFLITTQFAVESLVLTLISSVVGMILGLVLSNPVLNVLVNNAQSASSTGGTGGGTGRQLIRFGAGLGNGAGNALRNLHATIGYEIILYGLGAAVIIAIIGSTIPSFIISKVRPAEVLRSE